MPIGLAALLVFGRLDDEPREDLAVEARIAAAVSTPSGAPPMPITACTPLPATAAAMPADRSPSPISRMRAPVARISAMSCSWRGRSSTMTTRSSTRRPSACAIARRLSRTGASRSTTSLRARADDELLHVEVGRVQQPALLGRREHGDGVRRAGRAEVRAFERIDGDVDLADSARRRPSRRSPCRPSRRCRASAPRRARPRR